MEQEKVIGKCRQNTEVERTRAPKFNTGLQVRSDTHVLGSDCAGRQKWGPTEESFSIDPHTREELEKLYRCQRVQPVLENSEILGMALQELEIYFHHMGTTSPYGDMPNTCHSLIQQYLAQDPAVYIINILNHSDDQYRLISFPQPATRVPLASADQVNYKLPFRTKDTPQRTEMRFAVTNLPKTVLCMHTFGVGTYLNGHKGAPEFLELSTEDGIQLPPPIRMNAGDIMLCSFLILVGFFNSSPEERIYVISPQLVSVEPGLLWEDSSKLEGSALALGEIISDHRSLRVPKSTIWGIPYDTDMAAAIWHPAVELRGAWAVGDAICGARSWSAPGVFDDLQILFGRDQDKTKEFTDGVRRRLAEQFMWYLEQCIGEEKMSGSFFHQKTLEVKANELATICRTSLVKFLGLTTASPK